MSDYEEDTGDWEPPRKRGKAMFLMVFVGLVMVVVCSGGLWVGWSYVAATWLTPDLSEFAELEIPDVPPVEVPEPDDAQPDAPGLDGVAAVTPDDDPDEADDEADDEQDTPEEAPVEAASGARDQPAYTSSGSSSSSSSYRSSSSNSGSSSSNSGSSSSSSRPSSTSGSSSSSYRSSSSNSGSSSSSGSSYSSRSSSSGSTASSSHSSRGSSTSSAYEPEPVSYDDGLTDLGVDDGADTDPDDSTTLLDRYTAAASTGSLSSSDIMVVEMVQPEDSAFTRSRLLLVMNAKKKGDAPAVKRYLDELSLRPENQYNPVVLSEYARYYVNKRDYQRALDKAVLAERHWARLPPDLVFVKKAEIYEVEAAAYQGLFYRSEDNLDLLDKSIRHWQKYSEHVMTQSRSDLQSRAKREIEKLENIRDRLQ